MNVYLSAALASASNINDACARYDVIAAGLEKHGIGVYVPHHFTHPTRDSRISPGDVYRRDSTRLIESTCVVAMLDDPSFGVGAEVALAMAHGVPVIGVVSIDRHACVSRYIAGLLSTGKYPELLVYDDLSSLVVALAQHLTPPDYIGCSETKQFAAFRSLHSSNQSF